MPERVWVAWSPRFAPHVEGRYSERVLDEDGLPEPQRVECTCTKCGAKWQTDCSSGQVRGHIAKFGVVHAHSDPIGTAPKVVRPNSLRSSILDRDADSE